MAESEQALSISGEFSDPQPSLSAPQTWPEGSRSPLLSRKARDDAVAENVAKGDDPDNYPLNSPWTFWHDATPRGSSAKDFFANLKPLCTVKTIKAFWGVVNNIRPVRSLGERESYHLMRNENRRPIWEDADNAHGGLWSFKVGKMYTAEVWQELLLAAVGEQFTDSVADGDTVCGVSVRIRGFDQDVLQIWNEDSELHSKATVIQKVKELIPHIEINEFYQSNRAKMRDAMMKSSAPSFQNRGYSPPPHGPRRYTGAPPPLHGMYPPPPHYHPHHSHHPPPHVHGGYPPPPNIRQYPPPRQFRPHHPI